MSKRKIEEEARRAVERAREAKPLADVLKGYATGEEFQMSAEEKERIAVTRARRMPRMPGVEDGGMVDRVELVKRFVAGVSHELEKLSTPESFARIERELVAPGEALSSAASSYVQGGELGNFLLALDQYSAELRRICEGLDVRSLSD